MSNLKASILAANDLPTEPYEVKAWACTVRLKKMSGADRAAWRKQLNDRLTAAKVKLEDMDATEYSALFLLHTLCNEDGTRIFGDDEMALLLAKSPSVIEELYAFGSRLNALQPAAVESAAKNS